MRTLYVSQQGCHVSLDGEFLVVKRGEAVLSRVQLPLLEMVLIFGKSQMTTQALRSCLWRNVPVGYLSRMGYCYGRLLPIGRGYRQLIRYQQQLEFPDRLLVARSIVRAKLKNCRVILMRQQRRRPSEAIASAARNLQYLTDKAGEAERVEQLLGYEGTGAREYFSAFGECLSSPEFVFLARSRQPPGNPVNAMLSFGYQVLWNHLLTLIELQGLDPYSACLHEGNRQHAALASDLLEEFRAPLVDSLVLYLVNRKMMDGRDDFIYKNGGCYLNDSGRPKFLREFVRRMEETVADDFGETQPKWDLLNRQVKEYKNFVYNPADRYSPYQIR